MESSKSRKMLRLKFEEEGEIDPKDRLSSLPDSLIGEILSYLEFPSVVATSVLSRRWRHLWTQLTKLDLSWYMFLRPIIGRNGRYSRRISDDGIIRLFSAVDCILRHQTLLNFRHIVLHLYLPSYDPPQEYCYALLDAFVRGICHPCVETTEITLTHSYDDGALSIPPCIFQCQSLVSLRLCHKFDIRLPDDGVISLPKLKKLHMSLDDSSRELTGNLFGSFPVMEELKLSFFWLQSGHIVDISCPNLKKLVIHKGRYSDGSQFRIDAPKLEHFKLSDVGLSIYLFVKCPSGLIKADIHVEKDVGSGEPDDSSRMFKLLHGISNVRSLSLHGPVFNSFEYQDVGLLPVFHNMTFLFSHGDNACIWKGITICLLCSPNLEELYVYNNCEDTQKWMPLASTSACLLNKLKKVKIDGLDRSEDKLQMVQYILDTAEVLELLYVGLDHTSPKSKEIRKLDSLKFCKKLFMFPRSSSACEIKFHSSFSKASSKDFREGSLDC